MADDYLSIVQLSDPHIFATADATMLGINTAHYFQAVLAQAFADHKTFDLMLLTGDLAQEPVAESYRFILEQITGYGVPCVCLAGNHDDYRLMRAILDTDTVNCRKQVLLGDWQIISLNSQIIGEAGGYFPTEERLFLEQSLSRHPDKHALIAVHHHCLATGSMWMDTMMIENSGEFLAVVQRYPQVKAIVNGHIHQIMDREMGGVRILGTPSTCFQFKPHSLKFTLDEAAPAYRHLQLYADGRVKSQVNRIAEPLTNLQTASGGY
jgi:Icc protein